MADEMNGDRPITSKLTVGQHQNLRRLAIYQDRTIQTIIREGVDYVIALEPITQRISDVAQNCGSGVTPADLVKYYVLRGLEWQHTPRADDVLDLRGKSVG